MVNPSTESILNQMTNLAMDIALDYVLPASPMSDVCKSDLFEFERDVVAAVSSATSGGMMACNSLVASTMGVVNGCSGRPPTDLCKKNSYMGAAGCDSCDACLSSHAADPSGSTYSSSIGTSSHTSSPSSSITSSPSSSTTQPNLAAETTMDISWCQFDGCEFDTADNSYLDICDWIFYADRYALTEENREKVQKAFQMVPPGEVTGYVAQPLPIPQPEEPKFTSTAIEGVTIKTEIKTEPDDDYYYTGDNRMQPVILKAESNADILQITELDHSYLQTNLCTSSNSVNSTTIVSPVKHHPSHLVDMLGLVTPPPSRSQSSGEYLIYYITIYHLRVQIFRTLFPFFKKVFSRR